MEGNERRGKKDENESIGRGKIEPKGGKIGKKGDGGGNKWGEYKGGEKRTKTTKRERRRGKTDGKRNRGKIYILI